MNGKNLMKYDAIFFDFDGVLAECMNVKTEAFAKLYEPYGNEIAKKVVKHHIENGGISRYKKFEYYHQNYLNITLSEAEVEKLAQQFSDIVVQKVIESDWVKGVKEFLEENQNNIDMYVISGTPQNELKKIVKERNMEKYFKGVYGTPKTKPEIMNRIIAEKKYDKKRTLYIGDSLSDFRDSEKAEVGFLGRVPQGEKSIFPEGTAFISDFLDIK